MGNQPVLYLQHIGIGTQALHGFGRKHGYDFGADFKILTSGVRHMILKTAKNLLKQQQENNALLADILPSKKEKEVKKNIG